MCLVVERVGFGFVVRLIFETFVAAAHAVVGASTPEPRKLRSTVFRRENPIMAAYSF